MLTLTHTIDGEECRIYFPERRQDLVGFDAFLAQGDKVLSIDSETTGLDIFTPGFKCRLVQIGNKVEAWVLRVDLFADAIRRAIRQDRYFVAHNAPYDALVIDRHLGVKVEEWSSRLFDTRIFAHLIDPRQPHEGGAGLSLKPLSAIYVDEAAPDTQEGLTAEFRRLGFTKATGWAGIPIDNELYVRYAGLDVILDARLFAELAPIIKDLGLADLSQFEHHLQGLLMILQRRGMRLDVDYIQDLRRDLAAESEQFGLVAKRYGVDNVNSTAQISSALLAMGETLTETTDSGLLKVDKEVLMPLADLDREWQRIEARDANPLADAVLRAKRAAKWDTSYAEAFLTLRDEDDRLHPSIGSLAARTARMSVSRPPLQQLPSGDWKVRRAVVADPGHLMISSDYDQIELRVLAALADVKGMKHAIATGIDLHDYTATLIWGEGFTKFQRKLGKGIGFGKVYGGGKVTLARQTGAPLDAVAAAIAEYDRVYPEIRKYAGRLQRRAEYGKKEVITVSGRHLPLDRDRLYAVTNYMIQSTARDILAQAIVDCFDAGLGDYLLLPIHDELLAQAPAGDAKDVAAELGRVMSSTFYGVPLTSSGEVTGKNWGAAYGADPEAGIW
ncbi:DNA polymerase I [Arthrobacter phage Maureen]|uniref:DNA polymerase n=1 Tax=Arthrobacter phage Maureen TaxID=2419961 RepID=A0A3G2KHR6_9CAUD|nr:DNA polymerase I [Arthrobacter phage Maureen]